MANAKVRIDFSKVESFREFCRQMADQLGFDCACNSRDAFHERMGEINLGYHRNARLSHGETLRIGIYGFRAFSKRHPALAQIIEEHIDRLNQEALKDGHGAPLYEFVTLPFVQAEF